MRKKDAPSHYLYPLNPKNEQGHVLNKRGKEVPTSREGFFDTVDYNKLDKWGVSKNANELKIGDRIWVHFARPHSSLGAVGVVAREARWQKDWNRPAFWIRWDEELTEKLRTSPIPLSAYRQVPYGAVLAANNKTTAMLNRWLANKQAPTARSRTKEVRFRMAEVEQRVGQPEFRAELLSAYRGQCAVSGCAITEVLQAAHIQPVKASGSHSIKNGLLLRADLHNLFDRGLLTINDRYIVSVAPEVRSDPQYRKFHAKRLMVLPKDSNLKPSQPLLRRHQEFHSK